MRTQLEIGELRYTVSADECGKGNVFTMYSTNGDRVCPNVVVLALLLYPGTSRFSLGIYLYPFPYSSM